MIDKKELKNDIIKYLENHSEKEFRQQWLGEWNSATTDTVEYSSSNDHTGAWWGTNPPGHGSSGVWSSNPPTTTWPTIKVTDYTYSPTDRYPISPGEELGVVYIEGDEIKLRTPAGKTVTIGRLDDSDDFLPLEVIAAKKKLLEDPEPQEEA